VFEAVGCERFADREASWVDFDLRVLEVAADPRLPLLERVRLCAIVSSNLDEFFAVRVARLAARPASLPSPGGRTPAQTLAGVRSRVCHLQERQDSLWLGTLQPELDRHGIRVRRARDCSPAELDRLRRRFERDLGPHLAVRAESAGAGAPMVAMGVVAAIRRRGQGHPRLVEIGLRPEWPRFFTVGAGTRRLIDHAGLADRRSRRRPPGRLSGRAAGPVRRAPQPRVVADTGRRRRRGHPRPSGDEGARQAGDDRAERGRGHPGLRPHRHPQLPLGERLDVRRSEPVHERPCHRRRRRGRVLGVAGAPPPRRFRTLIVGPWFLRARILHEIDMVAAAARAGARARIRVKVNALVDPEVTDALYTASCAGADIDIVTRGVCILRPGVPGLSGRRRGSAAPT
jgi:hypothetical protein